MLRNTTTVLAISCIALALPGCRSDDGATTTGAAAITANDSFRLDERTPAIMYRKLEHAHGILDALAIENYAAITLHAEELTDLSAASDWFVHETASYTALSERFRASTTELARRARHGDLAATSDAYVAMMNECLACHTYLREEGLYRQMPGTLTMR